MIGHSVIVKRGTKSEAEKPFWISYADLMTALMVLFLVAMSVAMMAVTDTVKDVERQKHELEDSNAQAEERNRQLRLALEQLEADKEKLKNDEEALRKGEAQLEAANEELKKYQKTPEQIQEEQANKERDTEISALLDEVESAASNHTGVKVNKKQHTIDFGDHARFEMRSHTLTSEQARLLRAFVPEVLGIAKDRLGQKWLKQVVVEGFSSPEGDYLFNLNLSLQRSQRVLCVLMATSSSDETSLKPDQLAQIRDLFLVGGYSFNATKFDEATQSYDASRRVELRLEFLGVNETRPPIVAAVHEKDGECQLR